MKYRKKPVVIEAEQFYENKRKDSLFLTKAVRDKADVSEMWFHENATGGRYYINTLEGPLKVSNGDYIIKGIQGEFYPCKPDIFEATYEKVE